MTLFVIDHQLVRWAKRKWSLNDRVYVPRYNTSFLTLEHRFIGRRSGNFIRISLQDQNILAIAGVGGKEELQWLRSVANTCYFFASFWSWLRAARIFLSTVTWYVQPIRRCTDVPFCDGLVLLIFSHGHPAFKASRHFFFSFS